MAQNNPPQFQLTASTTKKARMLIARGLVPLPPGEMIELLVRLLKDEDAEVKDQASRTIESWNEEEILDQLKNETCHPSIFEYFAIKAPSDAMVQAILANPSAPNAIIATLAQRVPAHLLESILDNRVRIIESPDILAGIRNNQAATPQILRVVQEIETEFLGAKKSEYAVEEPSKPEPLEKPALEFDIPPEDLSLEGLPLDAEAREAEILKRLASLPVRDKIRYALFGNREIRSMLVRDTNREVARAVLRSPKLTDNEIEAIASMRNVGEDILREIGSSRAWTKSYSVVHNLVKNPKTPPIISQRLLFRLRVQDLNLLSRDRSISDAVRHNAGRTLRQKASKGTS